jgi:hypothetical protein
MPSFVLNSELEAFARQYGMNEISISREDFCNLSEDLLQTVCQRLY